MIIQVDGSPLQFIKSDAHIGIIAPRNKGVDGVVENGDLSATFTVTVETHKKLKSIINGFATEYSYAVENTEKVFNFLTDYFLRIKIDNSIQTIACNVKSGVVYICLKTQIPQTEFLNFLEEKIFDSVGIKSQFINSEEELNEI